MGSPRIIAGKAKGTRIKDVPGNTTRPITDRVKEALFNIIGQDITESSFLDLFGGTGSVGIEALSRGAIYARFIEKCHPAVSVIRENLNITHLTDQAEVILGDSFIYLTQPPNREFEYIYIAPPQYKAMWQRAIKEVDAHPGWLSNESWVIVQIHPIEYEKLELRNLRELDQRRYGSTLLVFYENV